MGGIEVGDILRCISELAVTSLNSLNVPHLLLTEVIAFPKVGVQKMLRTEPKRRYTRILASERLEK